MNKSSRTAWSVTAALAAAVMLSSCVPAVSESGAPSPSTSASPAPSPSASAATDESVSGESGGDSESSAGGSGSGAGAGDSSGNGGGSGGGGTDDSTGGQPDPEQPAADAPPAPETPTGPAAEVTNQKCSSGKLIVTLTAQADNSYRKGITSVTLARQNDYDVWLDEPATWLGPETGQGNRWTGELPGNQQNIGKTLQVVVVGTTGSTTITLPVTAPC